MEAYAFWAPGRARIDAGQSLGAAGTSCASPEELDRYLTRQFLPWLGEDDRLLITTADASAENHAWLRAAYDDPQIVTVSASELNKEIARLFRGQLCDGAVHGLLRRSPKLSAHRIMTRMQGVLFAMGALVLATACWVWPFAIEKTLVTVMSAGFALSAAFRAALALLGNFKPRTPASESSARVCSDETLPLYTVMVPLYHEAEIVPQLAEALLALDYPRDRLDIKLVLEEDDAQTCAVARELARRCPFDIIEVPPCLPRTKPKACNFALRFARGEYLVIYDAEDRPEPDQLHKAVARFRASPRKTACLQARLSIHNGKQSWLAGMFALDYAIWFKAFLPGLDRFAVPMPLGGTSNHFRTAILRAAGGWDPFNVTEDADLGIRLAQLGYRVSMLDSTTHEEAPSRLGPWLRQRSRWQKGYMQTWLVHARDPAALAGHVGLRGVLAFQLFIGGAVWSALVNPLLWLIFVLSCLHAGTDSGQWMAETFAWISGLGLLAANAMLAMLAMADKQGSTKTVLLPYGLSIPLYWIMISLGAYRGLWQLVFKPFYWEKTSHGQKSARRAVEA